MSWDCRGWELEVVVDKRRRKGAGQEQVGGRKEGRAGLLRGEIGQKLEQSRGNYQTIVMMNLLRQKKKQ